MTERSSEEPSSWPGLQISEDMPFQRRTWAVERIGWAVMALIIIAALLGLFSHGPLSSTTAAAVDGTLTVSYGRFERYDGRATIRIDLSPEAAARPEVAIQIGRNFLESYAIEHIEPQPARSSAGADGLELVFRIAPGGGSPRIYLATKPQKVGRVETDIGLTGGEPARLTAFIYP